MNDIDKRLDEIKGKERIYEGLMGSVMMQAADARIRECSASHRVLKRPLWDDPEDKQAKHAFLLQKGEKGFFKTYWRTIGASTQIALVEEWVYHYQCKILHSETLEEVCPKDNFKAEKRRVRRKNARRKKGKGDKKVQAV